MLSPLNTNTCDHFPVIYITKWKAGSSFIRPFRFNGHFQYRHFHKRKSDYSSDLHFLRFNAQNATCFNAEKIRRQNRAEFHRRCLFWVHVIVIATAKNYCFVLGTTSNFRCVWVKAIRNLSNFKERKNSVMFSQYFTCIGTTSRGHSLWLNFKSLYIRNANLHVAAVTTAILVVYSEWVLYAW